MEEKTFETPSASLLLEYVKGNVTVLEKARIEEWMASSPENEAAVLDIAKIYHARRRYYRIRNRDTEAAYARVSERINRAPRSARLNWKWAAAAAVAVVVLNVAGIALFMRGQGRGQQIVLSSNVEKKVEYTLPDGTRVYLNRNSSLTFPVKYSSRERRVALDGEAFFEVTRDPDKPFTVTAPNGVSVRVLGTKFNLEAYSADSIVQTTLIEGRVAVRFDRDAEPGADYMMSPADVLRYNTASGTVLRDRTKYTDGAPWMNEMFIFSDTPLPEVVRQLGHNFNVDFTISDSKLRGYLFTGTFDNRELPLILEYMKISSGVGFRTERVPGGRDRITLYDLKKTN